MSESCFQAQPKIQSLIYFSRGAAARAWRFNTFPDINFGRGANARDIVAPVSQRRRTRADYIKFWDHIGLHPSSMLPKFVLGVRYIASFLNWSASKANIRPNSAIFDPCKDYGGIGEMS